MVLLVPRAHLIAQLDQWDLVGGLIALWVDSFAWARPHVDLLHALRQLLHVAYLCQGSSLVDFVHRRGEHPLLVLGHGAERSGNEVPLVRDASGRDCPL